MTDSGKLRVGQKSSHHRSYIFFRGWLKFELTRVHQIGLYATDSTLDGISTVGSGAKYSQGNHKVWKSPENLDVRKRCILCPLPTSCGGCVGVVGGGGGCFGGCWWCQQVGEGEAARVDSFWWLVAQG
jgi:hypothetical protein